MNVFVITGYDYWSDAHLVPEVYADGEKASKRAKEKLIEYLELNNLGPFEPEKLEVYGFDCLYDDGITVCVDELEVIR